MQKKKSDHADVFSLILATTVLFPPHRKEKKLLRLGAPFFGQRWICAELVS